MGNKMSLGDRMKAYENVFRPKLVPRSCVIVRIDGRAFHTWTKKFGAGKPFDKTVMQMMMDSAVKVANDMQGFKLGYVQSDEASFLITDFDELETQGWFDYNHSKIVSISASVMTCWFNRYVVQNVLEDDKKKDCPAFFDSRAFVVPDSDVTNYFLWRSRDWSKNGVQMLARSMFSQKDLHGKNLDQMHEMIKLKGNSWYNCTDQERNGTWIVKNNDSKKLECRHDISPSYEDISGIVKNLIVRDLIEAK